MYAPEIVLDEQLSIVEDLFEIRHEAHRNTCMLIPDNKAEIIIPLSGDVEITNIGSVRALNLRQDQAYFFMPRRRGTQVMLKDDKSCIVIKINPIYAGKLTNGLSEVFNGVYMLDLQSHHIKELMLAKDLRDRYAASDVLVALFDNVDDLYDHNPTILDSLEVIKESAGTVSVKEIYSSLNVSKSKLEQHFNRDIGLTPKECCKIEKINSFINAYCQKTNQSLTELTYLCGYYDQSHLIKDFKYFLDISPKKFFHQQLRVH